MEVIDEIVDVEQLEVHLAIKAVLGSFENGHGEFLGGDNCIFDYCAHDRMIETEVKAVGEENVFIISRDKAISEGSLGIG